MFTIKEKIETYVDSKEKVEGTFFAAVLATLDNAVCGVWIGKTPDAVKQAAVEASMPIVEVTNRRFFIYIGSSEQPKTVTDQLGYLALLMRMPDGVPIAFNTSKDLAKLKNEAERLFPVLVTVWNDSHPDDTQFAEFFAKVTEITMAWDDDGSVPS